VVYTVSLHDALPIWQEGRVVDLLDRVVGQGDTIDHAGIGGDDVHAVLAAEAFLDNFQVEQSEESATETEAEGDGGFGLVDEGGVDRKSTRLNSSHQI